MGRGEEMGRFFKSVPCLPRYPRFETAVKFSAAPILPEKNGNALDDGDFCDNLILLLFIDWAVTPDVESPKNNR